MGFSNAGADRFLNPIIGKATTRVTGSSNKVKLHTGTTPTSGNELSGNGYTAPSLNYLHYSRDTVDLDSTGTNPMIYHRLLFPAIQWFANAGPSAQTAKSVALWHGSTLIWHRELTIEPDGGEVFANAGDLHLGVELSDSSLTLLSTYIQRGIAALGGSDVSSRNMFWVLHSGSLGPYNGNHLTGGGIGPVAATSWTHSTVGGWRRVTQSSEIVFSTGLTADTNAEPNKIALWEKKPGESGARPSAWMPLSGLNMTARGSRIIIPADSLYFEVNLAGVVAS